MAEDRKSIKFSFRKAAARDLPTVVDLFEKNFRQFLPASVNSRRMFSDALVDEQNQELVVAEDKEGNIAGFILMNTLTTENFDEINVDAVAVDEKFRGQGLGRALMEKAEDIALQFNFKAMTLQVHEENKPAITLYDSMGYDVKATLKRYYADGKNAYQMKKRLTPKTGQQPYFIMNAASKGYRA